MKLREIKEGMLVNYTSTNSPYCGRIGIIKQWLGAGRIKVDIGEPKYVVWFIRRTELVNPRDLIVKENTKNNEDKMKDSITTLTIAVSNLLMAIYAHKDLNVVTAEVEDVYHANLYIRKYAEKDLEPFSSIGIYTHKENNEC